MCMEIKTESLAEPAWRRGSLPGTCRFGVFPGRMSRSGDPTVKRKVAENSASREGSRAGCPQDAAAALAGIAGGLAGAVLGGNAGSTNGTAVAAAAVGATLGVMAVEAVTAVHEAKPQAEAVPQVVNYLQQHLGAMTTSYLSGADNLDVIGLWAEGKSCPEELTAMRLRTAGEATQYLVKAYGDTTARSWFLGTNDLLDRESPAYVLRHGRRPDDWAYVVPAARQFVENAR